MFEKFAKVALMGVNRLRDIKEAAFSRQEGAVENNLPNVSYPGDYCCTAYTDGGFSGL